MIDGLDRTIGEIGIAVMNPPKESGSVVINETFLDGLKNLFIFHETESQSLKLELSKKEQEINATNEKINKISSELNRLIDPNVSNQVLHTVLIDLEAFEDGNVELDITYHVSQTGWQPSYDIRVDTLKPSMKITYYGKLFNHSEEDWNDFIAVLSTAQPCLGGQIPALGTLEAHFYKPVPQVSSRMNFRKSMKAKRDDVQIHGKTAVFDIGMVARGVEELMPMTAPPLELTQNVLSTEFAVSKKSNLPNGTDDHKVVIGTIDLTPFLIHESVPSKNAAAFLTASAVNTSALPFLSGETSIFLDGAFVAKGHLRNISPGERFTCSLGVDTAIRVEYKPAKKFREEGGYITKHSAHVSEQIIRVKNTKSEQPVLLTIKHPVPRSTDEKIRVKLAYPVATPYDPATTTDDEVIEPKEGIRISKDSILEWTLKLAPNSTTNLAIKWIIEHAKGQEIVLRETF